MATPNMVGVTNVIPKVLASSQMANGDNNAYVVGTGKAAKIATATLCNVTGATVVISVAVVPSGGSVDGTHRIISGYNLQGGDSLPIEYLEGAWLGDGDKIVVSAGAAASVDFVLTGLECS